MEKSSKHYWGIVQDGKQVLFSGSFNECWKMLVEQYGEYKISEITTAGISISRIN